MDGIDNIDRIDNIDGINLKSATEADFIRHLHTSALSGPVNLPQHIHLSLTLIPHSAIIL
jgi:hypothetical protein